MEMLLAGDHPMLETLRQQFDRCCVTDRNFTGVGLSTSFAVGDAQPRIETPQRIVIDDVCADVEDLEHGCGFVLFVDDGLLGTLECHQWGDNALPEAPRFTRLYYIHQPNPPVSQKRNNVTWWP